jgi:hypothetical protein
VSTLTVEGKFTMKFSVTSEGLRKLAQSLTELADTPEMQSKTFVFPQGGTRVIELVFDKSDGGVQVQVQPSAPESIN